MNTWHRGTSSGVLKACGVGALVVALGLPACGAGYVDYGGYDAEYVAPPVGVNSYPTYAYRGSTVYDVNGRYYAQRDGRWVHYRRPPPEVERWHYNRGSAERQRR
jgi:hypothetical protein